jgi:nicotinamide mononucleotide transporter
VNWNWLEALAAAGNLAYTVLMLYERRIGWAFGFVASALGVVLFLHAQVYAQAALSAYYVAMGAYGWWSWGKHDGKELNITRRPAQFHAAMILGGLLLAGAINFLLLLMRDAQFTVLDGIATAFSLLATWMLARKILENWAYWIAADLVAIILYALLGLWWYAALYAIYVGISAAALVRWGRQHRAKERAGA